MGWHGAPLARRIRANPSSGPPVRGHEPVNLQGNHQTTTLATTRRSARNTPRLLSMEDHDHDRYGVVGELWPVKPNSADSHTGSPTELPKANNCITFKVASWGFSTRGLPIF